MEAAITSSPSTLAGVHRLICCAPTSSIMETITRVSHWVRCTVSGQAGKGDRSRRIFDRADQKQLSSLAQPRKWMRLSRLGFAGRGICFWLSSRTADPPRRNYKSEISKGVAAARGMTIILRLRGLPAGSSEYYFGGCCASGDAAGFCTDPCGVCCCCVGVTSVRGVT